MMSKHAAYQTVYACILLISLPSVVGGGDLTWMGHAQVAVVLTGLLVLYRRYGDRLPSTWSEGGDEADPRLETTRPAAVLAAMTLIFTMAQFAPPGSGQPVSEGRFAVVSALVLVMFAALIMSEKRSRIWPPAKLDWLALAVTTGGLAAPLLADLNHGAPVKVDTDQWSAGSTWTQVPVYLLAWIVITRCFSDPEWGGRRQEGGASWGSWMRDRWRGSLVSVVFVLGVSLAWGAVRAGAMVYHYEAGHSLAATGDREAAESRLHRALALSEGLDIEAVTADCLSELAILYFRQGSHGAGLGALRRLVDTASANLDTERRIADVYYEVGRWKLAAAMYEAHLHKKGRDPAAVDRLSQACLRSGDGKRLATVLLTYGDVPGLLGENADEHLLLGGLFSERGEHARAVAEYALAAQARPGDPYIQYKLGWSHMRAGHPGVARLSLERATTLAPGFAEADFRLALCMEALGRDQEAAGHYTATLERLPAHLGARLGRQRLARRPAEGRVQDADQ